MRQYWKLVFTVIGIVLQGCDAQAPEALGTLEWDRINGRAVASETIVEITAKEGDQVSAG